MNYYICFSQTMMFYKYKLIIELNILKERIQLNKTKQKGKMKSLQQMRKRLKKNQQIVQEKPVQKKQQQLLIDETQKINLPSKLEKLGETPKQIDKFVGYKEKSPEMIQHVEPAESQEEQSKSIQLQNNKNETPNEIQILVLHGQTLSQAFINIEEEQIRNVEQEQIVGIYTEEQQIINVESEQIVRAEDNFEKPAQTNVQTKQIIEQKQPLQQLQTEKSPLRQSKPIQPQQTPNESNSQPPTLQPKKSKIQMLRQKIRLKKIAQQIASSNPDIQQSPFKRQPTHELQSPTKYQNIFVAQNQELIKSPSNEEKPAQIQLQQQNQKNSIQQRADIQLEIIPVHEQRVHPEVISEILVAQNQKQALKQNGLQLKPEESFPFSSKAAVSHSLFYQLNQLDQYLVSNQTIHKKNKTRNSQQLQPPQSTQTNYMLKDFLQQIQRLKKNLSQCQ